MNADAIVLSNLYANPDVFIARKKNCVADGFLTGKFDKVCYDKRIDTLLLACTIYEAQAQLYVVKVSEGRLLRGGSAASDCTVIPIDSQKLATWSFSSRNLFALLNCLFGV